MRATVLASCARICSADWFANARCVAACLSDAGRRARPKGLRTLDPSDWCYRPRYDNGDATGGFNYHQVSLLCCFFWRDFRVCLCVSGPRMAVAVWLLRSRLRCGRRAARRRQRSAEQCVAIARSTGWTKDGRSVFRWSELLRRHIVFQRRLVAAHVHHLAANVDGWFGLPELVNGSAASACAHARARQQTLAAQATTRRATRLPVPRKLGRPRRSSRRSATRAARNEAADERFDRRLVAGGETGRRRFSARARVTPSPD